MAKRWNKALAFALALCMCASSMNVSAWATKEEVQLPTAEGAVNETIEVEVTVNENKISAETPEEGVQSESGLTVKVDGEFEFVENENKEEELVNGELKYTAENSDGTYKAEGGYEVKTDVDESDDETQSEVPEVEVTLNPGETATGSALEPGTQPSIDGEDTDRTDGEWDYTKTSEIDRTVTAEASDVVTNELEQEILEWAGPQLERYEDKDGVWYRLVDGNPDKPLNTSKYFDAISVLVDENGFVTDEETATTKKETRYVPRYTRNDSEMPDWLKSKYTSKVETDENGIEVITWIPNESKYGELDDENDNERTQENDFDFVFARPAENSHYVLLQENGWVVDGKKVKYIYNENGALSDVVLDPNGEIIKYSVEKDADGNTILDEYGLPKYKYTKSGNLMVDPNGEYYYANPSILRLIDEYGNYFNAYCMDKETGTIAGDQYVLENLNDATYFPGTEEEQAKAKEHVRAIALKGYWGTGSGIGSLEQIKADLIKFINENPDFSFTYKDPETVMGNLNAAKTPSKTYSGTDDKEEMLKLVEKLNEGAALAVTQSAVWEYGRSQAGNSFEMAFDKGSWESDPEFNHAMALYRAYLLSDELRESVNNNPANKETTIIDQNSFIEEDSLKLTVKDKAKETKETGEVTDYAANTDNDSDNDIYNVDVSFKMIIQPGANDDLVLYLMDGEGNVMRKARLAGDDSQDEKMGITKLVIENGSYVFKDLPLAENSGMTFDLRISGTQKLEEGVYIYKAAGDHNHDGVTDYSDAQTMVGIGKGSKDVNVSSAFTVKFDVDETDKKKVESFWRDETLEPEDPTDPPEDPTDPPKDPIDPPEYPTDPQDDDYEIEEEDVPLVDIPDELIPLANVPQTGVNNSPWSALAAVAGLMMAVAAFSKKK